MNLVKYCTIRTHPRVTSASNTVVEGLAVDTVIGIIAIVFTTAAEFGILKKESKGIRQLFVVLVSTIQGLLWSRTTIFICSVGRCRGLLSSRRCRCCVGLPWSWSCCSRCWLVRGWCRRRRCSRPSLCWCRCILLLHRLCLELSPRYLIQFTIILFFSVGSWTLLWGVTCSCLSVVGSSSCSLTSRTWERISGLPFLPLISRNSCPN